MKSKMTNNVVICDSKVPVAIVVGARAVGKSMMIIRLCLYLRDTGFSFYVENDSMRNYFEIMHSNKIPPYNGYLDFGLINIIKEGNNKLQILDFSGEYLFGERKGVIPEPLYRLTANANKIIWLITIDLHSDIRYRHELLGQIERLQHRMRPSDKIIILVTKADLHVQLDRSNGSCNYRTLEQIIQREYPGLLHLFENHNKLTRWWRKYKCDVLAFSAGTFYSTSNREKAYHLGSDIYPRNLWNILKKHL